MDTFREIELRALAYLWRYLDYSLDEPDAETGI